MDRLLWWTKWKNQSSERRKTCLKLSREPKPHVTTGVTLQLCVYSHFLCVYSIFADLLLGSSFLHLWMMFSLPNFLPINTFHDLTFDTIILSPFSPFFFLVTEDCFFYASSFKDLSVAFKKVLMILYLFYISVTVWISGKGFGLGVKSLLYY